MEKKLLQIIQRGYTGEVVDKDSWDLDYVALPTAELVEKYNLEYDETQLIPTDEAVLRSYFAAGRELLLQSGVYNASTKRVITFTAQELDEALASSPQSLVVGRGAQAHTLAARRPGDGSRPSVVAGNPGCPTPERLFKASVKSWAKEPVVDMITCGSLTRVDDIDVRNGEPSEVVAVHRELRWLNEAAAEVGRPGLGRLGAESSVTEIGDMAACAPGLMQPGDAHLTALNNELITNRDNLVRAVNLVDSGVYNATLACVMAGGMGGGAPGATLLMIASLMAGRVLYGAHYHLCHPIHLRQVATSARECIFMQTVTNGAFALCAPCIIVNDIYPKSGAMTMELLYEAAASAAAITAAGGHLEGVGSCDGLKPHGTGLEVRLMGEVGRAVAKSGWSAAQTNAFVQALYAKYAPVLDTGNEGVPFDEAYDLDSCEPKPAWLAMYEQARAELAALGLVL